MATIGLYDIDFHHNKHRFTINLFLAQMYAKLKDDGHQIIMMKPFESCSYFNKIFWFKESSELIIPSKLNIDSDKSSFIGHGFTGYQLMENAYQYTPCYSPYDFYPLKSTVQRKYNSIKTNNFIDWRTKDMQHWKSGKAFTYVHDADFLDESDWKDIFKEFNNNIEFIRPINFDTYEQMDDFLKLYKGHTSYLIKLPTTNIKQMAVRTNVAYNVNNEQISKIFLYMLFLKCVGGEQPELLYMNKNNDFSKAMYKWYKSKSVESFNSFTNRQFENTYDYKNFPNKILLKQNPKTISEEEILNFIKKMI